MKNEKAVEKAVREDIESGGGFVFKTHGNAIQDGGLPDIIACFQMRYFGIEVKHSHKKGHKLSQLQLKTLYEIKAANGFAMVVDKDDYTNKIAYAMVDSPASFYERFPLPKLKRGLDLDD